MLRGLGCESNWLGIWGVLELYLMETAGVGAEGVFWVSTQVTLDTSIGLKEHDDYVVTLVPGD